MKSGIETDILFNFTSDARDEVARQAIALHTAKDNNGNTKNVTVTYTTEIDGYKVEAEAKVEVGDDGDVSVTAKGTATTPRDT